MTEVDSPCRSPTRASSASSQQQCQAQKMYAARGGLDDFLLIGHLDILHALLILAARTSSLPCMSSLVEPCMATAARAITTKTVPAPAMSLYRFEYTGRAGTTGVKACSMQQTREAGRESHSIVPLPSTQIATKSLTPILSSPSAMTEIAHSFFFLPTSTAW